ncbi:heavy metal response regulator transcription factor [Vibrio sp. F74]|uniref:heavy metal response regulator transcription factor n=1 Tax=Vibrio sp. F74 TaxID=700020 RepID=UPI0035F54CC2
MKILVIEDEKKTGQYLQKGLTESGYVVDFVDNGIDGLYYSTNEEYNLIILDIMLPHVDGWQILSTLRGSDILTPVILLTAKELVEDKVRGFELGANDYVVKPYAFAELLARIKNVFKNYLPTKNSIFQNNSIIVSDLELDIVKRIAVRKNQTFTLTAKEYLLLELLMRRKGEVLSRSTIASLVWDMNFDSDTNVIDVAIKRLRTKIDKPFNKPLIHTVRGMGYKLENLEEL